MQAVVIVNDRFSPRTMTCPTCGQHFDPSLVVSMPFCSSRCQHIDLGRWLDEQFGLPVEPEEEPDDFGYLSES